MSRGYMIEAFSLPVVTWDIILSAAALYNAVYVPLALAMPGARWSDDGTDALFGYLLDGIFVLDVFLRFRVSYRDHGYPVFNKQRVATKYLRAAARVKRVVRTTTAAASAACCRWRRWR